MEKSKLLDRCGALGEDRLLLAKVLDRAEQAQRRSIPAATDFLSPAQRAQAEDLLRLAGVSETTFASLGGYEAAERRLLLFLPDWLEREDAESQSPLRCLRAVFRAEEAPTHRDLLGSLMGLGIVREKVGDILVGPDSADLIVLDTVADFLLQNWTSAGRTHLRVTAITPEELRIPQVRTEEVRDTVSSLRLDAVIASALRMSRGKAAEVVERGAVQVNWRPCAKPDRLLAEGDTVSARGFGKFQLAQVGGFTKKGRTAIVVKRYV